MTNQVICLKISKHFLSATIDLPVICATLNPRSTSDEPTFMVAKMCFAMFSCFELESKISWNWLKFFISSTFRQFVHFYSSAARQVLNFLKEFSLQFVNQTTYDLY